VVRAALIWLKWAFSSAFSSGGCAVKICKQREKRQNVREHHIGRRSPFFKPDVLLRTEITVPC
jgi:hypothetical protein